ncbi:hypothetical protein PAXRUDRAFT_456081 [Paxillus rubicundulus Ve08.2h10]|uniref:Uncharacterized protein n=1 Tax=Paxillus rubicundulus Ve08.2h10 TaxID=930991 RepID=A0A0D0E1S2_9AGAM|nr:hypothetical protein PAXRUDRAFT_456081 [Paxillus rubicundulus Ve08.2h10]
MLEPRFSWSQAWSIFSMTSRGCPTWYQICKVVLVIPVSTHHTDSVGKYHAHSMGVLARLSNEWSGFTIYVCTWAMIVGCACPLSSQCVRNAFQGVIYVQAGNTSFSTFCSSSLPMVFAV